MIITVIVCVLRYFQLCVGSNYASYIPADWNILLFTGVASEGNVLFRFISQQRKTSDLFSDDSLHDVYSVKAGVMAVYLFQL